MPAESARTIALPSGEEIAALGQGTWYLGEDPARREQEIAALRLGVDLGMTVVDTAEMYGDGAAEELVGEATGARAHRVRTLTWPPATPAQSVSPETRQ